MVGVGVAEALCATLSGWGYLCHVYGEGGIQRITARGSAELSTARFRDLVSDVVARGGALYGFRMTVDSGGIERPVDDRPAPDPRHAV